MYVNTRAVARYAGEQFALGSAVSIFPSDNQRALWVDIPRSHADAERIEVGMRADTYDDWDAWLWQYGVTPKGI